MRTISNIPGNRVVELDPHEVEAKERFDDLLDEGYGINEAADITAMTGVALGKPLSDEFVAWLES